MASNDIKQAEILSNIYGPAFAAALATGRYSEAEAELAAESACERFKIYLDQEKNNAFKSEE